MNAGRRNIALIDAELLISKRILNLVEFRSAVFFCLIPGAFQAENRFGYYVCVSLHM